MSRAPPAKRNWNFTIRPTVNEEGYPQRETGSKMDETQSIPALPRSTCLERVEFQEGCRDGG